MTGRIEIDYKLFHKAFKSDARYHRYLRQLAIGIINTMIEEFLRVQNPDNDFLDSPTSPPKYIESFYFEIDPLYGKVHIYNRDPAWNMVEWGAHAFGKHWVLGYKPMTRGLQIYAGQPPSKRNTHDPGNLRSQSWYSGPDWKPDGRDEP